MGKVAKVFLQDKDLRNLTPKEKMYLRAVGSPKELYVKVYPSGIKTFVLKVNAKYLKIKEFRAGLYSVAEARKEALELLKKIETGVSVGNLFGKSKKYQYGNLFKLYLEQKKRQVTSSEYLRSIENTHKKYILPSFENRDIKTIKYSEILAILNAIFIPKNHNMPRIETIHKLIDNINGVFKLAQKDRYISFNDIAFLHQEFPTREKFNKFNGLDGRYKAITNIDLLKDFLLDLKLCGNIDLQTKRAIYLQILTANRPFNTVSAKWSYIDFDEGVWNIPFDEMKTRVAHQVALSSYAIKILKEQYLFSKNSTFVFPSFRETKSGHLNRDSIGKAIRTSLSKGKYVGLATSHGFRATFKTICSTHEAELLKIGIGEKVIEECLAHKESNEIIYSYERAKATLEQKIKLMQWYGDFLNKICAFFE